MISDRELLEDIRIRSKESGIVIVLPFALIKELDGLKRPLDDHITSNQRDIRKAIAWVYDHIANGDQDVRAQKYSEVFEDRKLRGDESILDCCRYFREKKKVYTVLLSNDKNLCNLAIINEIPTVTGKKTMTADLVIATVLAHAGKSALASDDTKHVEVKSSVSVGAENDAPMNENDSSSMDRMDVDMDDIVEVEKPRPVAGRKIIPLRKTRVSTGTEANTNGGANSTLTITQVTRLPQESRTSRYPERSSVGLEGSRHRSPPSKKSRSAMDTGDVYKVNTISENVPPMQPKLQPMSILELYNSMLSEIVEATEQQLTQIYSKDLKYMYDRPKNFEKLYQELSKFWLPVFSSIVQRNGQLKRDLQKNRHLTPMNRPDFVQVWSKFYLSIAKNPDRRLVEHWKTPVS